MSIIEKIRAEVERRITDNTFGAKLELIDILAWLDTLQEQPVCDGLEEAVTNYIAPIENEEGLNVINFSGQDIKDAFIAGAEWRNVKDGELMAIVYGDGIRIGMTKQKEQMMKKAVEGEVVKDINNKLAVTAKNVNLDKFKFGDKVRIIIFKEE